MSGQNHIIKRVLIDLKIHGSLPADHIREKSLAVIKNRIIPMVGEYLDALTADGGAIRAERWELNLGTITAGSLESNLTMLLQERLQADEQLIKIKQQNAAEDDVPELKHTEIDLIVHFLQTGMLPWWVKSLSSQTFELAVDLMLQKQPLALKTALLPLLDKPPALRRLIAALDDGRLRQIAPLFNPAYHAGPDLYEHIRGNLQIAQNDKAFRQAWWRAVLYQIYQNPEQVVPDPDTPGLMRIFFESLAQQYININKTAGVTRYSNILQLYQSFAETLALVTELKMSPHLNLRLHQIQKIQAAAASPGNEDEKQRAEHAGQLWNRLIAAVGLKNIAIIPDYHYGKNTETGALNTNVIRKAPPDARFRVDDPDARTSSPQIDPAGLTIAHLQKEQGQQEAGSPALSGQNVEDAAISAGEFDIEYVSNFTATDRFPVSNSGLILLWPFLGHLFSALSLTQDNEFESRHKQYKACLLLLYAAMGEDMERFEGHLPVIKLLCGLKLTQPVDVDITPGETEISEADNMLSAVTSHVPAWKNLSLQGLRQAYLQRPGILSTRDGNWLLQVERLGYDILIDRLPWANRIIKLPWMEHLIFVEWQQD